jgi:hypothetical protein
MHQLLTPLITLALTIVGSGLGTTIVAALFKRRFDTQLERHKALLLRASRVHEKQIDALSEVYSKLERANAFLQRTASSATFAGEDKMVLMQNAVKELVAASEAYSARKLLIPPTLTKELDTFFGKAVVARLDLSFALSDDLPPGEEKGRLWRNAQKVVFDELSPVLEAIELEARRIIHAEEDSTA